jgi:hypothetical protein
MDNPMDDVCFVYDGIEVKKTGRVATRKLKTVTQTIIEIQPKNENDGTWTKWINPIELFEIKK